LLKKTAVFVFLAALFLVIQVCAAQPIGSVTTNIVYKGTGHIEEKVNEPGYSYHFYSSGKNVDIHYSNTASLDEVKSSVDFKGTGYIKENIDSYEYNYNFYTNGKNINLHYSNAAGLEDISTNVKLKMDSGITSIDRALIMSVPKIGPVPVVEEIFYASGNNVSVHYKYDFPNRFVKAKVGFGELDDYYIVYPAYTGHATYMFGKNMSYRTMTLVYPDLSSIHVASAKVNLSTFGVFAYEQLGSIDASMKTSTTVTGNATVESHTGVIPAPYPYNKPCAFQSEFVIPNNGVTKVAFDALSYVPSPLNPPLLAVVH